MNCKAKIMGILNVTPDSFSDGGKYIDPMAASARACELAEQGADIIDIGGESTGPGSVDVSPEEELRRAMPVLLSLQARTGVLQNSGQRRNFVISIDTWKAEVAAKAIEAGAEMVNDVTALRGDPDLAYIIAQSGVPVVLMYSKDSTPRTTHFEKHYDDIIQTISDFFEERIVFAEKYGIRRSQIILDPGMGAFISSVPKYSYEILVRLAELKKIGLPILVGTSRKSFLPGILEDRLFPTLAASLLAIRNGADIIRVHDVFEHSQFLKETYSTDNAAAFPAVLSTS